MIGNRGSLLELMYCYETPPQNTDSGTETQTQNTETGGASVGVFSRDEWDQYRQGVDAKFSEINEGIGWLRERMTQTVETVADTVPTTNPPETVEEPESESGVTLEVQDRQTVRNQKPRTRLNLGNLLRPRQ